LIVVLMNRPIKFELKAKHNLFFKEKEKTYMYYILDSHFTFHNISLQPITK